MQNLKALEDQIVVLTGASSGIGLATARRLGARGAKLVLVSRNEAALADVVRDIEADGGEAIAAAADVGERDQVIAVRERAVARFGRIDTWINDAGVAIYGAAVDVPWEDQRRLFDTNYWGVVAGSLEAVAQFARQRGAGSEAAGKLINVGSVLSDRAMIFQGPYSASKAAVKGFTDALRMELEEADAHVSVTLVKPGAIDTPYMEHATNHLDARGTRNPPPSYDPELVAEAIEHACENDPRDLVIGAGGWIVGKLGQIAPALTDAAMKATGRFLQSSEKPPREGMRDNLHEPRRGGSVRSSMPPLVPGIGPRRTSALLAAQERPLASIAMGGLAVVGLMAAMRRR